MEFILALIFFIIALLYGAVGLGGGSGYLAVMGIMGMDPEVIRLVALALNILVALIGTWKHIRAGQFSGRIFWPIALISIPMAFIGGRLSLPGSLYGPIVGLVLLYAAWRLWLGASITKVDIQTTTLPIWMALLAGAVIGLISGLVGIGGGILLGPLLLLAGWAKTREAMGITAAFVLANSVAGLAGRLTVVPEIPQGMWLWIAAAAVGGWVGAEFGSQRLNPVVLRRLLALILVAGALRMIIR